MKYPTLCAPRFFRLATVPLHGIRSLINVFYKNVTHDHLPCLFTVPHFSRRSFRCWFNENRILNMLLLALYHIQREIKLVLKIFRDLICCLNCMRICPFLDKLCFCLRTNAVLSTNLLTTIFLCCFCRTSFALMILSPEMSICSSTESCLYSF